MSSASSYSHFSLSSFTTGMSSVSEQRQSQHGGSQRSQHGGSQRRGGGSPPAEAATSAQQAQAAANKNRGLIGAMILALCIVNVFEVDFRAVKKDGTRGGRRSLLSSLYLAGPSTLMPWAQHHVVDVTDRPDPEAETALFWRE